MVVKVYISGISGNKEVKKRQQRVQMILESKNIEYVSVDITEPGNEQEKEFMQQNSKTKDSKFPLPPQLFNEEDYCGDYDAFDLANEIDELDKFLKISASVSTAEIVLENSDTTKSQIVVENGELNGNPSSRENSAEKDEPKALGEANVRNEEKTEELEKGDCGNEGGGGGGDEEEEEEGEEEEEEE